MTIIQDENDLNPYSGYDAVEVVSRPTETIALKNLYRAYRALQASKLVRLSPLHTQVMRLEMECWRKHQHYNYHDVKLVYEYIALSANLMTFERGKLVPDIFIVENLLAEASLICYMQEMGVSVLVEDERAARRAA